MRVKPWDMAKPELKKLYNSKRWKIRQAQQLQEHPLCAMCLLDNRVTAARVADHVTPHRGNVELFYDGVLQSLCLTHHNRTKQQIEQRGFHSHVDVTGKPIDENHPANRRMT